MVIVKDNSTEFKLLEDNSNSHKILQNPYQSRSLLIKEKKIGKERDERERADLGGHQTRFRRKG